MFKRALAVVLIITLTAVAGVTAVNAEESIIAGWIYNSAADNTVVTDSNEFPANEGTYKNTSILFGRRQAYSTSLNAPIAYSEGTTNCITFGSSGINLAIGDYYQINFSTREYNDIKVDLKSRNSSGGPRDLKWRYSLTGNDDDFTDLGEVFSHTGYTGTAGSVVQAVLPEECNDSNMVYLRLVIASNVSVGGSTISANGTWGIRDIEVNGTLVGEIENVDVTGVTVNKAYATLYQTDVLHLNVTVAPHNATNQSIIWISDNESTAVVDETGKVTAISGGVANIKAVSEENEAFFDLCVITVIPLPPSKIAIWNYSASLGSNINSNNEISPNGGNASDSILFGRKISTDSRNSNAPLSYVASTTNCITFGTTANNLSQGDYYQFNVSTKGYTNIVASLNSRNSSTGPKRLKWQYSLTGTDSEFSDLGEPFEMVTSISEAQPAGAVLLPAECENADIVFIRITIADNEAVNGSLIGANGTWGINNIRILGNSIVEIIDSGTQEVYDFSNDGTFDVSANFTAFDSEITLYVSIYTPQGNLKDIYLQRKTYSELAEENFLISDIPYNFGQQVKVFLWDENYRPLTRVFGNN